MYIPNLYGVVEKARVVTQLFKGVDAGEMRAECICAVGKTIPDDSAGKQLIVQLSLEFSRPAKHCPLQPLW